MGENQMPNRCRIVLIAPTLVGSDVQRVEAALSGGDVASLMIPDYGTDEAAFQSWAEQLSRAAQARGVAAIIAGEPRIAARVQADGIHVEASKTDLADAIRRYQGQMMVGSGGVKTRDDALELGETQPDYIFFGRFGYDNKPDPHARNLALGTWWAEMISIPSIVMAGSEVASVKAVAETGAEFVAVGAAVFGEGLDPATQIAEANRLLDEHAPAFEETSR